ncbi:acetate--CoA ligase [Thalassotalea ponticola]|uniref:acetate--CoA ligase n=1 Tax=Thalassotalea ponticola TaxID=1523392 RepID=UPI0025B5825D|nr:acetate--CoA ligase [Thalassotalea ponticola]MDN3653930.1 acetate--CoA ligase [Thalassotalea ponticola]
MVPLEKFYPIKADAAKQSYLDPDTYQTMYQQSLDDPDTFWAEQAVKHLDWFEPFDLVSDIDLQQAQIKWFAGGKLNVSHNCIDRHLAKRGEQTAIIFEGDEPGDTRHISYNELHQEVCKFANVLKARGVKKGDRVCIYMPMIPETGYAMLACARIGAVHSVVFGGFSSESIKSRILDADCQVVITADQGIRGGKVIPLKDSVDAAVADCPNVHTVLVFNHRDADVAWNENIDVCYQQLVKTVDAHCPPEPMDAEDPLFILYTSGSTGTPKGVLHTCGGYLLYAAMTHKYVFDYRDGDIYWCTADAGWITGHSYVFYGPLANGATTLVFEGVPNYPDESRCWDVVERHRVNIFYTAPTAIRALMGAGDQYVTSKDLSSLRLLGTVGEPINPEAWFWYYKVVGNERCPIVDTWWQTETGGVLITSMPGCTATKPGAAGLPFFGIQPQIIDKDGVIVEGEGRGALVMSGSWPGQMRTVYGNHDRFYQTYFSQYDGVYFTGDGAMRDSDGYYWILGRLDDVLNVSGHRLGTAEIESALVLHPLVSEAAVVGYPHEIKGQGVYAYVTLMKGAQSNEQLTSELMDLVAHELGSFSKPDLIQYAPGLPKTRSGKIMRRILRKVAENKLDDLGDTTTLADPSVVADLIDKRLIR